MVFAPAMIASVRCDTATWGGAARQMMYAQRGHGKRSSFYSDYTVGCWSEEGELLPVAKAYSGFTDEELKWLDGFVRNHTLARFGPVREVEKSLVA